MMQGNNIGSGILVINGIGEHTYDHEGHTYYRYMDKIFIPKPPFMLNKFDVAQLSEIRIRLGDDVIDYDYSLQIVGKLYNMIQVGNKISKILDFGCGDGMFCSYVKKCGIESEFDEIIGADISTFAVDAFKSNHDSIVGCKIDAVVFDDLGCLEFDDGYFDSIISSFVMHFNIYENQFFELSRVLKKGGIFVYNDYIYNRYKGHAQKVIQSLNRVGFSVEDYSYSFKHPVSGDIKNHRLVCATKI
ncbi:MULTISPECIES: class I SAM-dependent methyltransferase [Shewanella]|uniref:class I SAM-dependent methyltransferase n=1 Tax=Shewanella TaxID=22 RepID=UPI00217D2A91|nr:class I SAM-dependent methyltransferase [Shewanella baltica]MCS6210809.1 class I SAM-dependent methyltransferase [Shewanella baltica]